MITRTTEELLGMFWAEARKRGDKARMVHALIALPGASMPAGTMIAWGVNRGYIENRKAALPDADKWDIQERRPDAAL